MSTPYPPRCIGIVKIAKPDEVLVSMEIKMSLADWKELRNQLNERIFPAYFLREQIKNLVDKVEERIVENTEFES